MKMSMYRLHKTGEREEKEFEICEKNDKKGLTFPRPCIMIRSQGRKRSLMYERQPGCHFLFTTLFSYFYLFFFPTRSGLMHISPLLVVCCRFRADAAEIGGILSIPVRPCRILQNQEDCKEERKKPAGAICSGGPVISAYLPQKRGKLTGCKRPRNLRA